MPRISSQIEVKVIDQVIRPDRRTLAIHINARQQLFQTSDLLASAGALGRLEFLIKKSIRSVITRYIEDGRKLAKKSRGKNSRRSKRSRSLGGQDKRTGATPSDSPVSSGP